MGENNRRMGENEEMFLSCKPEIESLATLLFYPPGLKSNRGILR